MDRYDVLIAGAGPTGMVLALSLAKQGARVCIVDRADEPGTTSRAMAVQARTLELYRPLGLADEAAATGRRPPASPTPASTCGSGASGAPGCRCATPAPA